MPHKQILLGEAARAALLRGVHVMARAVKVTLGPKGRSVVIARKFGSPKSISLVRRLLSIYLLGLAVSIAANPSSRAELEWLHRGVLRRRKRNRIPESTSRPKGHPVEKDIRPGSDPLASDTS